MIIRFVLVNFFVNDIYRKLGCSCKIGIMLVGFLGILEGIMIVINETRLVC